MAHTIVIFGSRTQLPELRAEFPDCAFVSCPDALSIHETLYRTPAPDAVVVPGAQATISDRFLRPSIPTIRVDDPRQIAQVLRHRRNQL